MDEENACVGFTLRIWDKIRNYLVEKINHNELISKKHRKTCSTLNFIEHLLILALLDVFPFSDFTSWFSVSLGIRTSAAELKICVVTTGI